ncbi:MAG: hypothetical protein ACLGG1_02965 [Gammaproteobacteria bacterium]
MSHTPSAETVFWNNVLTIAEAVLNSGQSAETLRGHLLALEEGFLHAFDPADSFQEYATLTLCRSIRRFLESGGAPGLNNRGQTTVSC